MVIILIILFSLAYPLSAQELQFQQEQFPFPVSFYGIEPQLGFTAANSYYHPDFGDLNADGDFDLIIGAGGGIESYIENTGTVQMPIFQLITTQIVEPFSGYMYQSPTFCDIDSDNDLDVFITGFDGYIIYYQNIGTPNSPIFLLSDSSFEDIDIIEGCVLDFIDIDSDNDNDLFIGGGYGPFGGKIYYYENIGNSSTFDYLLITNFYSNIDVGENASPEFCDIDADGDYDLFIGCDNGTVWYYENVGDSVNYDFQYVTSNYFNIDVGNMSVPRFCDIDADGDYDLFVANESAGYTNNLEGDITFFRNIGTPDSTYFEFVTAQYLFMDMSATSGPYAVDIDSDGLQELLVGIIGGPILLFENNGSVEEPSFYFADSQCFNMSFPYQPQMAFGDLDADGDLDMVVSQGSFTAYVELYQNIGNAARPEYELWRVIESSSIYSYHGLDLVDIEGDNDLDLFVGYGDNLVKFFENTGSQFNCRFELQTNNYLNQTPLWGELNPRFSDLDHDGDFDLMIGRDVFNVPGFSGNLIEFWRNVGDSINAVFFPEDTLYCDSTYSSASLRPCFSDIDNDGDLDMFVGESGGALLFYRNLENPYQAELTISISGSDVIFNWENVTSAVEYRIYYSNNPYFIPSGAPQAVVLPPDTTWMDAGAVNLGQRWYRVVVEY